MRAMFFIFSLSRVLVKYGRIRFFLSFSVYSEILSKTELSKLLGWFGEAAFYSKFDRCARYTFHSYGVTPDKLQQCFDNDNHLTIIRSVDDKKFGYFSSRFSSESFLFEFGKLKNNMTQTSSSLLSCFQMRRFYRNCDPYQFKIETPSDRYNSIRSMTYSSSKLGKGTVATLEVFTKGFRNFAF